MGILLVKVGQVPALCSAEVGASLGGGSVRKGLCSSTSSISYLPTSTPTVLARGRWCTLAAHLGPALGYLLSKIHEGTPPYEHISPWVPSDLTSRGQGLVSGSENTLREDPFLTSDTQPPFNWSCARSMC